VGVDIAIKYWPDSPTLEKTDVGSWIDLYIYEETVIKKGEHAIIPLGVAMKLPEGYEAIIAPRSSTFKNYGVIQTNSIGIF
jgi:dUTP pyrophosphatase